MNELDAQRLICKSAVSGGGFAFKMSNRFLVGVPDLLVKIPQYPTMLIEVKLDKSKVKDPIDVEVTPTQGGYLRRARAAGMVTGVASFLQRTSRLCLCIVPTLPHFTGDSNHHSIYIDEYEVLDRDAGTRQLQVRNWLSLLAITSGIGE